MNFLGQNIRYLRRQHSNTQTELASLIQKGQTTIGNWENGISEPNVEELLILSNYFDISLDILIKIDLSKTNWAASKKKEQLPVHNRTEPVAAQRLVTYDHSSMEESVVREKDREDLAYVVKEISSLRDEIRHIQSRLNEQHTNNRDPEQKKTRANKKSVEEKKPGEKRRSREDNKLQGSRKPARSAEYKKPTGVRKRTKK
jgi:transcriptional regulator with XRE-family HTH domain